MTFKRIICFFISFLILQCVTSKAITVGDTIIVKPIEKKKKPYPALQPLILKTSASGFLAGGSVLLFTSEYRFCAEITTGRKQSDQVAVSYLGKNVVWTLAEKTSNSPANDILKVKGVRLQYTHKFYLVNRRHQAPFGFYFGPHFSYTNAKIFLGLNRYYHNTYFDVKHVNADLIFGVQVGKPGRVTLDISAGGGWKSNTINYHHNSYKITPYDPKDIGEYYNGHVHLFFDLSFGYAF